MLVPSFVVEMLAALATASHSQRDVSKEQDISVIYE
jgi:hypothetical protein